MAALGADEVLQESLSRAHRLLDDAAPQELLDVLEQSDRDLKRRLKKVPGGKLRFTEAQAMMYQKQIDVVIRYVKKRLLGITDSAARASIQKSVYSTARDIEQLNQAFTGISTPLRLRQAGNLAEIVKGTKATMLQQVPTSVDRYGAGMIQDYRKLMMRGMLQGVTQDQMVDALVGHGGPRGPKVSTKATVDEVTGKVTRLKEEDIPEGLFVRKRYWAQRVVRTEVAHGQNEARLRTITRSQQTDFPDMGKKILAMMDNRTAMDSLGVHGQVRPTDGLFMDGAGRQYLRPPARPNDRETIVPWRMRWQETPYSAQMPPEEIAKLQQAKQGPGPAKRVAIRQARASFSADMGAKSRRAMRRVNEMVGGKLAKGAVEARKARRVLDHATAVATAQAHTAAAKERAAKTLAAAERRAAEQAQRYVTANGQARAARVQRAKNVVAQAHARRTVKKAEAKEPKGV